MADTMHLRVIAPERIFYDGEVTMVEFRTTEGNRGVYPGHVAETCIIQPGELVIHEKDKTSVAALHAGFLEIRPDEIRVLAEIVEWPDEIDIKRAERAKLRAERQISRYHSDMNLIRAEMALQRSLVRLQAAKQSNK